MPIFFEEEKKKEKNLANLIPKKNNHLSIRPKRMQLQNPKKEKIGPLIVERNIQYMNVPKGTEPIDYHATLTRLFKRLLPEMDQYYGVNKNHLRVAQFKDWFIKNKSKLFTQLIKDIETAGMRPNENQLWNYVGMYLGGRYVSSRYSSSENLNFPTIKPDFRNRTRMFAQYSGTSHTVSFDSGSVTGFRAFLYGLNGGMHEFTHALQKITGTGNNALNEIATYYTQDYLLPVKPMEGSGFDYAAGARDFETSVNDLEKRPGTNRVELRANNEYVVHVMGPWLKRYFGANADIFKFQGHGTIFENDMGLSEAFKIGQMRLRDFIKNDSMGLHSKTLKKCIQDSKFDPLHPIDSYTRYERTVWAVNGFFNPMPTLRSGDFEKKIFSVFYSVYGKSWKDIDEFYNKLKESLNEVFGSPVRPADIPQGFVYSRPPSNVEYANINAFKT